MKKQPCTAIVLAAGSGKRMGTKVQKQYLELAGKPILYYSLQAFEDSPLIDDIILVTGEEQIAYCKDEIIEKYQISKVRKIIAGGKERYDSVWNGLQEVDFGGYVFIHDGARPFVTNEIIERAYNEVIECRACVVGMPVKDTIKIADEDGYIAQTPNRKYVWQVQTPQVFETELVKAAYAKMMEQPDVNVTDDAQVVESMMYEEVKLVEGSYENIKITTPEDLEIAKIFVKKGVDSKKTL